MSSIDIAVSNKTMIGAAVQGQHEHTICNLLEQVPELESGLGEMVMERDLRACKYSRESD